MRKPNITGKVKMAKDFESFSADHMFTINVRMEEHELKCKILIKLQYVA
jgi:hypothetical protein